MGLNTSQKLLDEYDAEAGMRGDDAKKVEIPTGLVGTLEMTEEEIEERYREYEGMREGEEWKGDENYIPSEDEGGDEEWVEVLRKENEEVRERREGEAKVMEDEVNRDLRKYLGVECGAGGRIGTPVGPVGTALRAVRKMSDKNKKLPITNTTEEDVDNDETYTVTAADEAATHHVLSLIHSRDSLVEAADLREDEDDVIYVMGEEEERLIKAALKDPAPSHLPQEEAAAWEKAERAKIRHQLRVDSQRRAAEQDRETFKNEVKQKAVERHNTSTIVSEHLKKKRGLAEKVHSRDETKTAQEEAARARRYEDNKRRFQQAQRNNKARSTLRQTEAEKQKIAEQNVRKEVFDDMKKNRVAGSGYSSPKPPGTPPP